MERHLVKKSSNTAISSPMPDSFLCSPEQWFSAIFSASIVAVSALFINSFVALRIFPHANGDPWRKQSIPQRIKTAWQKVSPFLPGCFRYSFFCCFSLCLFLFMFLPISPAYAGQHGAYCADQGHKTIYPMHSRYKDLFFAFDKAHDGVTQLAAHNII